jgi:hypothetical protein
MKTSTKYGLGWICSVIVLLLLAVLAPSGSMISTEHIEEPVFVTDKTDHLTEYGVFKYYITVQLKDGSTNRIELSEDSYNHIEIASEIDYSYSVINFSLYGFCLVLSVCLLLVVAIICGILHIIHSNDENNKDKT